MTAQSPRLIEARDLAKTVNTQDGPLTILQGLDLSIGEGETVAIIGSSGSGKSTLLGLLAGMDVASAGDIHVQGQALSLLSEDQRAQLRQRLLGFVFQSFQLLPDMTALENVMLPLELAGADALRPAQEWLQKVGLGHRLKHTPRQLSGGEQQRVAIARAFASNPRLLLADEPTGNLDSNTGQQIIDLLFSANASTGTTLVLVTHDEQLAQRCQRRLRLEHGRLTELS